MNDVIVTCEDCGQRNRLPALLPVGKAVRCGRCKSPLDLDGADDGEGDDLDDEGGQP